MTRLTFTLITFAAVLAALHGVAPASAATVKRCGAVSGPTTKVGSTRFNHYAVFGINADCDFAKRTVAAIVKQHLPNSLTPVRLKGPSGWICVAQEVDSHVAAAGHCQRRHPSAFSWVGVGLHV